MTSADGNGRTAARDPEADRVRLRAIHAAATSGDISGAARMAETALGEGIDHPMVLSLVAGRREEEGRLQDALGLLQRAKVAAPQAPGILNALGLNLHRQGRYEEAIDEFDAALAADPGFAIGHANRGMALVGLARLNQAHQAFEAAIARDPGNLLAVNGLAALALRRGLPGEARRLATQVLAREPDFPGAVLTLAGADIAEGRAAEAETVLTGLIEDNRISPEDRFIGWGLIGDARDALGRPAEAFAAWGESNAQQRLIHRAQYQGQVTTSALVGELARGLEGRKLARAWGQDPMGGAKGHVFLIGFPRSGTTLLEQVLEGHEEVTTLAEKECMVDGVRAFLADGASFARFLDAPEAELDTYRTAYWTRVGIEGADPAGKIFVDKHPFNTFKLPLIARLFPEARILFARRDPRDIILSCYRHRFQMTAPVYQMLSLEGAAELFDATMTLTEASERAFGLYMQDCVLEKIIADFDGETKAICAYLGIPWHEGLRDFAAKVGQRGVFTPSGPQLVQGLNAQGVGKWRDYADELAPVLPVLAPWVEKFGYA